MMRTWSQACCGHGIPQWGPEGVAHGTNPQTDTQTDIILKESWRKRQNPNILKYFYLLSVCVSLYKYHTCMLMALRQQLVAVSSVLVSCGFLGLNSGCQSGLVDTPSHAEASHSPQRILWEQNFKLSLCLVILACCPSTREVEAGRLPHIKG